MKTASWIRSVLCTLAGFVGLWGPGLPPLSAAEDPPCDFPECIRVKTKQSLLHLGSLDSFDITAEGTRAARELLNYIEHGSTESLREAIKIYKSIIPNENFGGEYTSLHWIAECLLAEGESRQKMLADRYAWDFFEFVIAGHFEPLRQYLIQKYHLAEKATEESETVVMRQRGMEDFLLFNNPRRENWEKSSKILEVLNIKPGNVVVDVGCGPGYFTFKFADLVGPSGRVYALDPRDVHIMYINRLVQKYGLHQVRTIQVFPEDRDPPVQEKADRVFMCSLYHFLYASLSPEDLASYLASLRNLLKDDGRLVIIDNDLVHDETLPYHGPYIAKELIIRQFEYSGFKLCSRHQFIPQRYVLIFEKAPYPQAKPPRHVNYPADCVPVTSGSSLITVLIRGRDTGFTDGGRAAARLLYLALQTKDPAQIRAAIAAYDALIPKERFGDEYSALRWFCDYLLAPDDQRRKMLADRHDRDYFQIAANDDFALLKKYVRSKYLLDGFEEPDYRTAQQKANGRRVQLIPRKADVTLEQVITWGEIFTYANPTREQWEKTNETLDFLKIKPRDVIGDVGCGAGYYTYRFAKRVGPGGRVYAVDTNKVVLDHVTEAARKYSLPIVSVLTRENNTGLPPQSCDLVFICTMYHAVYLTSIEYVKDQFIGSIKAALKPGGRFVIADNTILPSSANPFYGPRIQKELIISQMKYYGFRLVDFAQPIPQRYVLVFQRAEGS
jgi:predicted methyltransferase